MRELKVLSLFDGMSCGKLALDRLGIPSHYGASEIKEDALKVVQENYPDTKELGSVTELMTEDDEVNGVDLLIGGSPCQDLSIAMKNREGLEGSKSKLFFEYLRIKDLTKPKYFLLENVGRMSKENKDIITELMGVEPVRINSSLVSAQLRDRLYWTNIPQVGELEDRGITLQSILENGWTDREKARCLLESDSRPLTTPVKMFHRYYSTGFNTLIFKSEQHYNDCKAHYEENFKGHPAKFIDVWDGDLSVYTGVRYLTQSELEELQTVPKGYTDILTRNQAASLLGDGWTVDIIAYFFRGLKTCKDLL